MPYINDFRFAFFIKKILIKMLTFPIKKTYDGLIHNKEE